MVWLWNDPNWLLRFNTVLCRSLNILSSTFYWNLVQKLVGTPVSRMGVPGPFTQIHILNPACRHYHVLRLYLQIHVLMAFKGKNFARQLVYWGSDFVTQIIHSWIPELSQQCLGCESEFPGTVAVLSRDVIQPVLTRHMALTEGSADDGSRLLGVPASKTVSQFAPVCCSIMDIPNL